MSFDDFVKRYSLELGVENRNFGKSVWDYQQKEIDTLKLAFKDEGILKTAMQLCSEIEELKSQNKKAADLCLTFALDYNKLNADLEKCKEVLGFYADEDNYDWEDFISRKEAIIIDDGKRARQTLKELEEE